MNLGPAKMTCLHRQIVKTKTNKRLIKLYLNSQLEWGDQDLKKMKESLRYLLRIQQESRCIFCRRPIKKERKNSTEDIEHFLDKSKKHYKRWAFHPLNLTLACHPCNMQKTTIEMGDNSVKLSSWIYSGMGTFKWLHPYFDNYHDNIEIEKGWFYRVKDNAPNAIAAHNMINECKLDSISEIEKESDIIKIYLFDNINFTLDLLVNDRKEEAIEQLNNLRDDFELRWFDF